MRRTIDIQDPLDGIKALFGHYLAAHKAALSMPFNSPDRPAAERAKWGLARELARAMNRRSVPAVIIHADHSVYLDTNGELVVRTTKRAKCRPASKLGGRWAKVAMMEVA